MGKNKKEKEDKKKSQQAWIWNLDLDPDHDHDHDSPQTMRPSLSLVNYISQPSKASIEAANESRPRCHDARACTSTPPSSSCC